MLPLCACDVLLIAYWACAAVPAKAGPAASARIAAVARINDFIAKLHLCCRRRLIAARQSFGWAGIGGPADDAQQMVLLSSEIIGRAGNSFLPKTGKSLATFLEMVDRWF